MRFRGPCYAPAGLSILASWGDAVRSVGDCHHCDLLPSAKTHHVGPPGAPGTGQPPFAGIDRATGAGPNSILAGRTDGTGNALQDLRAGGI